MNKISARVVGDSLSPQGHRITTMELVMPRYILAEFNTHRMFSRNSASSRAIPFEKMVKSVTENPFIPIAWQKHHKGMQGTEYITDQSIIDFKTGVWLRARDEQIHRASELYGDLTRCTSPEDCIVIEETGVTKQLANRLLEPFMYHKVLVTATEWENFFELRAPQYELHIKNPGVFYRSKKDLLKEFPEYERNTELEWFSINKGEGEIHIMDLAEKMWDAMNESTPKQLKAGDWHIAYEDEIKDFDLHQVFKVGQGPMNLLEAKIQISTGKAARASYISFGDEKEVSYETLIGIHDKMLQARPFHASPFEHCAQVMDEQEYNTSVKGIVDYDEGGWYTKKDNRGWSRNFRGFKQYREIIEEQYGKEK